MSDSESNHTDRATIAARCHEIQVNLGRIDVPEFETIPEIAMAIRLALNLRGLPIVNYRTLKLVSNHFLDMPSLVFDRILQILAEVEFVRLQTEGKTITGVLPTIPYYESMYDRLGEFALASRRFAEHETLALELVNRLAQSPEKLERLRNQYSGDGKLFERTVQIATEGSFLIRRSFRTRDILINPTYFSENSEIYADEVSRQGSNSVSAVVSALRLSQGWPLSLVEQTRKLGESDLDQTQISLLKRLAQDGCVKPPSIETRHAGKNYFLFSPTPSIGESMSPIKRDIYEKAMAIVAAVRQGQLLPRQYAIRSPQAVIYTLKTDLRLRKATTEATQQYRNLVHLRVGQLVEVGQGFSCLKIIDTPENREALKLAYNLVSATESQIVEVDEEARKALQSPHHYIESLVSSSDLRNRESVKLSPEMERDLEILYLGGKIDD